jgi:integrase
MATIRRRGAKWQVQIRRVGFRSVSRSFHVRQDAQAWARLMEVRADRRDLPDDPKALQRVTLGELVERYRDTVTIKKRGAGVERIVLDAFLRHPICRKRLSDIGPEDFAAYRDERLKTIKPGTLKRGLSPLHNMLVLARDEWGLPLRENPLDKVRLKSAPTNRERRLKEKELERLLLAAGTCRNRLIAPIVLLAIETGMRRGEIRNLRWEHIHRLTSSLTIPHSKNGHPRSIPLTDAAIEILGSVPETDVRVFPISANALRLAWDRLTARAGVIDLHFHDLRHEAISRLFEKGLSVPEVALVRGHRDARMLFRYTHPKAHAIAEKLKAFDQEMPASEKATGRDADNTQNISHPR